MEHLMDPIATLNRVAEALSDDDIKEIVAGAGTILE